MHSVSNREGGEEKCQRRIKPGLQARAVGHMMVEVEGKAVHQERAQALKLGVKRESANQRGNLTPWKMDASYP